MRTRPWIVVVTFVAASIARAAPSDADRLAAGEILVKKPATDTVRVVAVIDAPPEKVWPIVNECALYKKTMPNITDSQMLKREASWMMCKVTADIPFPLPDLVSVTRADFSVTADRWERRWKMIEGDYDKNEGSWVLEPYGADKKKTLATYTISAKPKMALPDAMVRAAQESNLPSMMRNLRKQVTP